MVERLTVLALAASALGASAVAYSQNALPDPTRPPAAPTTPASGADALKGQGSSHRLQSVLISGNRKLAVIDGRPVQLGGKVAGATVTSISEIGVTLKRGSKTETLRLNPAVRLQFHPPPANGASEAAEGRQ